jgi:hypothetical protein
MMKKNIQCAAVFGIVVLITFLICLPAAAFYLPDTGQTQCFSNKGKIKIIPCPQPGDPLAQDGSYAINPPSYTVNSDGTVLDKNTNLMWQRQDDSITRTWFEAKNYCDSLNLGGYADWLLPSKRELTGIVNYGQTYPSIDRSSFPNTKSSYYWTSTTMTCYYGDPWSVDFASGYYNYLSPSTRAYTRCVRGGPLPFAHFMDNSNGTVSDLSTGLMWQQNEQSSTGWTTALSYCEGLSSGGYSDWRVPNVKEYESLTHGSEGPSIMSDFLNFSPNFPSWSSTTYLIMPDYNYKWTMDSKGALSICSIKDKNCNKYSVRCVRGRSLAPIDEQEIRVSPTDLDFWNGNGKGVTTQEVVVLNAGKYNLAIGTITGPSPPFSITSDECSGKTLSALMSCTVSAAFNPADVGNVTDHMTIPSSDADHPTVVVDLKGAAMSSFYLPDTGQGSCYNANGNLIGCPVPGSSLAQDGSYDMNHLSYTLYTETVRDNNTSLVWQQQDDGFARTWDEALLYCEDLNLGGYTDWRFPTMRELTGIVDYGRHNPTIDLSIFPATKKQYYWSSSSSDTYKDNAWFVNFSDGTIGKSTKSYPYYVRCVRGAQLPLNTLVDNGDGTTTDLLTGLIWQQGDSTAPNWESSLAYCENLALGGYADWRVPNIRELSSIIDIRYKPAMNHEFFPQVACGDWSEYWTSTSYLALLNSSGSYVPDDAYVVDFFSGSSAGVFEHKFYNNYNVRCVRAGTLKLPAVLTGTITDSSTGLPVSDVHVTVRDSIKTHTTSTDPNGLYALTGLSSGSFAATFEKAGYSEQRVNGTLPDGQTLTLGVRLTPIPSLTVNITAPLNGAVVSSSPITVTGNVSNDAAVTVNGFPASANNGSFSVLIHLQGGQNTITALASDQSGQTATHTVTVILTTKGSITGMVTESLALSPVQSATVSVTDSLNSTQTTLTGADGRFHIAGIEAGAFRGTITKEGFNPFTFTGTLAPGETITINAALTKIFSAKTLGDYGNVTVMEITGNYDAKNPDGSLNFLPRQEIAKEFLRLHPDEYDFLIIFSNFAYSMPDSQAKGFYLEVKNDTQGIGKPLVDNATFFGSNSKLQGIIDMGNLLTLITDPRDSIFEETINTLAHEHMHRWGASLKYKDAQGSISTALLGKDASHWSFLLDSDASLLYGNEWQNNGNGTFTSIGAGKYYSPLDLYLMGFYDKSKLAPMLLIENPSINPSGLPEPGIAISGTPRYVTIDDIIAAEGERIPNASTSQKVFKVAFILISNPGTFTSNELPGIENIRNAWAGRFSTLTGGKGSIADVAPSLTIAISSPSQGDIISTDITVKGAVINSTGNDTGVTVNGIPAAIYGNQFVVNHVPLDEGINTITATATDSTGNTASTQVTGNAIANVNYIRLRPNLESGIAPLELTLSMDGSFSFDEAEVSVTGPSQPELLDSNENEYRFAIAVEGIYSFTVSVTAPDGNVYQDTVSIPVMNTTQIDNLLRGKWEGMRTALANQHRDTAVNYFVEETKPHYHDIFTALDAQMPQIVQDMEDIQRIYVRGNTAKYRIRKDEPYGGQIMAIMHYIYFSVDHDGLWKIDWY